MACESCRREHQRAEVEEAGTKAGLATERTRGSQYRSYHHELLNQDVKSNGVGRRRPTTREELIDNVRSYLRGTQRQPEIVRNYFKGKHVTYAA